MKPTIDLLRDAPRAVRDPATGVAFMLAVHPSPGPMLNVSRYEIGEEPPLERDRLALDARTFAEWLDRLVIDQDSEDVLRYVYLLRLHHEAHQPQSVATCRATLAHWAARNDYPPATAKLIRAALDQFTP